MPMDSPCHLASGVRSHTKHNGIWPTWPYPTGIAVPFGRWSDITHQTQWDMASYPTGIAVPFGRWSEVTHTHTPNTVGHGQRGHIPLESPCHLAGGVRSHTKHSGIWPAWPYPTGIAVPFGRWSEITQQTQWDMASVAWDNACWRCHALNVLKGSAEASGIGKRAT